MSTFKPNNSCAQMTTIDGPLGDYPDQFRRYLENQDYSKGTIKEYARCIKALGELMREHGIGLRDIDESRAVSLMTSWKRALPRRRNHIYAVNKFVKFLTDLGAAKPVLPTAVDDTTRGRLKRDYEDYLQRQQALSEKDHLALLVAC